MSKKVLLGIALALVIVAGSLTSAQAQCGFNFGGCLPKISLPSLCCPATDRDMDRGPAPTAEMAPFTNNFADPSQPLSRDMYERDRALSW